MGGGLMRGWESMGTKRTGSVESKGTSTESVERLAAREEQSTKTVGKEMEDETWVEVKIGVGIELQSGLQLLETQWGKTKPSRKEVEGVLESTKGKICSQNWTSLEMKIELESVSKAS